MAHVAHAAGLKLLEVDPLGLGPLGLDPLDSLAPCHTIPCYDSWHTFPGAFPEPDMFPGPDTFPRPNTFPDEVPYTFPEHPEPA